MNEQERFEQWAMSRKFCMEKYDGIYISANTDGAWHGWQAAIESRDSEKDCPKVDIESKAEVDDRFKNCDNCSRFCMVRGKVPNCMEARAKTNRH
jgi:hypothetical protein